MTRSLLSGPTDRDRRRAESSFWHDQPPAKRRMAATGLLIFCVVLAAGTLVLLGAGPVDFAVVMPLGLAVPVIVLVGFGFLPPQRWPSVLYAARVALGIILGAGLLLGLLMLITAASR